jgi:hypothetical protein
MNSPSVRYLTIPQKVRLALSVFAIYWPIRLYINTDSLNWNTVQEDWPIWIVEFIVTVLFFTFWLSVTEWLEQQFVGWLKGDFLLEFKLSAQLVSFLVAAALAVVFNEGYHRLWHYVDYLEDQLEDQFRLTQQSPTSASPSAKQHKSGKKKRGRRNQDRRNRNRQNKSNNGITVMAMLSAFYLAANRRGYQQLETLRVNAEQLKREATQAQFAALKNQVNPHFLFNSLSILTFLVEVDTKLSVQFINRLSKVYRYILEQRESEQVSLKTELEFLEAYTFLLNIRFEGKLQVFSTVPPEEAARFGIAPLTLQLLVENAVKHNQMSEECPLVVSILLEKDYLLICNPLQLRPQAESSTGLGLQNIVNRYRLLTNRPVWAGEQDGNFVVKIPLLL